MMYMLKVDLLVAAIVFGFAGSLILALFAWSKAQEYARALRVMQRISFAASREPFAISRVNSRNRDANSLHAA